MDATQTKTKICKIAQSSPSGFYVEKVYIPNYENGTVTVKKFVRDPWGVITTGWKKPEIMTIEKAREDYRHETMKCRFERIS